MNNAHPTPIRYIKDMASQYGFPNISESGIKKAHKAGMVTPYGAERETTPDMMTYHYQVIEWLVSVGGVLTVS